jgi:hypothetical protein
VKNDIPVINYTKALSMLIEDVGRNVVNLSFIDMDKFIVIGFSRKGERICHPYRTRSYYSGNGRRMEAVQEIYLGERRLYYLLLFNLPGFIYLPFTQKFRLLFEMLLEFDPAFTGHLRYDRPKGMDEELRTLELWCRYLINHAKKELIEFLVTEWEEVEYDELTRKLHFFPQGEKQRVDILPEEMKVMRMKLDLKKYEQPMINRFIREASDYQEVFEYIFRRFYPRE